MMTWEYLCDTINIELFNFQLKYASCDIYNKPTQTLNVVPEGKCQGAWTTRNTGIIRDGILENIGNITLTKVKTHKYADKVNNWNI